MLLDSAYLFSTAVYHGEHACLDMDMFISFVQIGSPHPCTRYSSPSARIIELITQTSIGHILEHGKVIFFYPVSTVLA